MHDLGIRSDEYVTITDSDLQRLLPVLDHHGGELADPLENELQRAVVVAQREVSPDIVTMNSDVVYEDVATGARRTIRIVYPKVLAPVGAALLGRRDLTRTP